MEQVKFDQIITITNKRNLTINGVDDIAAADENSVVLDTKQGRIHIEGASLKIESLESDGGRLVLKGDIIGLYSSESSSVKKGFFSKLFG